MGSSSEVEIRQGIQFAIHDAVSLQGDLYLPAGPGPHPGLIGVSGGAWRQGHRGGLAEWGTYLAVHGIAFFTVDYRRATTGKMFPEAACDVRAGIQFLRGSADEFGLDQSRIGLLGASAGGHLASLVALAGGKLIFTERYQDDRFAAIDPSVQLLIGVYGVYDLVAHWQECLIDNAAPGRGFAEAFLGAAPFDDQKLYFDASPIRYVSYASNKLPVLLIWGTEDDAVMPSQSKSFLTALRQARFPVRSFPVLGAGHFWFSDDPVDDPAGFNRLCAPRILKFLRQNFARKE